MKTVNEMSKLAGISMHTLHYYDAIELLKPTLVGEIVSAFMMMRVLRDCNPFYFAEN